MMSDNVLQVGIMKDHGFCQIYLVKIGKNGNDGANGVIREVLV